MLGVLLDSGRPLPQALELLMVSGYFPPVVVDKLRNARLMLERGEPLGPTLASNQLLPPSMAPLIQAAERNKHLPTALKELGEHLGNRAIQLVRHLVMVLSPVGILMVAVLVALVVIGMFLPLIKLLEALTK
jgi:type IV pilus assembly protein PilC